MDKVLSQNFTSYFNHFKLGKDYVQTCLKLGSKTEFWEASSDIYKVMYLQFGCLTANFGPLSRFQPKFTRSLVMRLGSKYQPSA